MSAIDDLKDRLKSESEKIWEKIQESSLYNQGKDRYESLNPLGQKSVLIGISGLVVLIILSFPLSYLSSSWDNLNDYETKRQLIRDLFRSNKEILELPQLQIPPDTEAVKSQVNSLLQAASLLPEQMLGIETTSEKTTLVPENFIQGQLKVNLAKLNLRQIVQIGNQIQGIHSNVKLKDLIVQANAQNSHYFDVVYKLLVLSVPTINLPGLKDQAEEGLGREDNKENKKNRNRNGDDSEKSSK